MAIATPVSVEEYLHTSYHPDCEYVDGELLERNVGEKGHSKVQKRLLVYLAMHEAAWGVTAFPEWRVRLGEQNYRVPDICVVAGPEPDEAVLSSPPLVCIEILSPEDCMSKVLKKIADYIDAGVQYVWVLNPKTKQAFVYTSGGMHPADDGFLRAENPNFEVPLNEIFD